MEMEGANQQLLQAEQQAVADSQQPPSLLLQQQQPLVLGGLGSRRKRWPETSMREAGASCLELKGVTAEGLQAVLEFVYTGSLALSVDRAEDILNTASHLQISEAVQLCIRFLQLALSLDNCVELLNLSELYCLDEFGSNVRTFLLENFEDLCRCGALQRLTAALSYPTCWATIGFALLASTWCFFAVVRLPLLSGEHLVEKVSCIGFMRDVPACSDRLTEAKDYHLVVNKQPVMQTPRTRVRNHQRSVVMCHAENLEAFNLATKRHAFLKDCAVPLYNPCICELANFLYACGGRYDGNEASEMASARCFRYDPRFDAWHELVPMNEARKDFALVATGNSCLMAIGGQDENMVMCTVERLCIATGEWRFLPSLQHAVYCHAAAVCDSRVFVSGGQRYDGYCDSLICYEPDSELWASRAAMLNKRGNHIMECVGSRLFVLGGNVEDIYGF
uniref:BTB domain-containing protein n=1 Tax=Macrostomum lignano TaxID=282301 RepID=A0A1I8F907_9PLAT